MSDMNIKTGQKTATEGRGIGKKPRANVPRPGQVVRFVDSIQEEGTPLNAPKGANLRDATTATVGSKNNGKSWLQRCLDVFRPKAKVEVPVKLNIGEVKIRKMPGANLRDMVPIKVKPGSVPRVKFKI
ncbi:MAG: hypothetical protein ABIH00_11330 [Armatimonadota bacterium]